ncbi:glycerophosphodiester phosphodiesterase [uncultured Friedmanniella sp.]|uniref:glycerophosphodiester phosphodiesterase n=1 Tax=uncultured Friedmanniella sp. TaxID=335381 RepID=UPI0035CC72E6
MPAIFAHRGLSSRFPEMTRAAYQAAIEWAAATGSELGLECDVHFAADDQLVCLHDLTLHRTAAIPSRAIDLTVAQLKQIDFGSWLQVDPAEDQRELITLAELLSMTMAARANGVAVSLVIETKHPNPRSLDIEDRLAEMLTEIGWDAAGSPVRVISFSLAALERLGQLLPALPRSLLVEFDLEPWRDGRLPEGVHVVGPELELLRADPGFVARARAQGNEVHVWTVNHPDDIRFCQDLGVTGLTTDYPDLVTEVLATPVLAEAS